jgi:hypothetical protein
MLEQRFRPLPLFLVEVEVRRYGGAGACAGLLAVAVVAVNV